MNLTQIMLEMISLMTRDEKVKVMDSLVKDYQSAETDEKKEITYKSLESFSVTLATLALKDRNPEMYDEVINSQKEALEEERPFSELEN